MKRLKLALALLALTAGAVPPVSGMASGPDRTPAKALRPDTQLISEDRFREIFTSFLCRRLDKEPSDVLVSRFRVHGNGPVPQGDLDFQLFQKDKRPLAGHVRLMAVVIVNGVARLRVQLAGWADIFEPVVCARRNLKKGDILGAEDLHLVRKNISRLSKIFRDPDRLAGLQLKYPVAAETPLKEWMMEKPPAVEKGDMVVIMAEDGILRVTAPGRILEKGYPGDLVRVENIMSSKEVYGKVVHSSLVLVNF